MKYKTAFIDSSNSIAKTKYGIPYINGDHFAREVEALLNEMDRKEYNLDRSIHIDSSPSTLLEGILFIFEKRKE